MTYDVTSVSRSNKSNRAQVTVLIGEGRNRRSITRHVKRRGFSWVGFNPDPRAIPLNEKYEKELAEAKADMASAKTALETLQKRLPELETIETEVLRTAASEMLRALIEATELEVYAAELKLAIVQRDVPLEVEFIGPGLN